MFAMADHRDRQARGVLWRISGETESNDVGLWRIRLVREKRRQVGPGEEANMPVGVDVSYEDKTIHPEVEAQE